MVRYLGDGVKQKNFEKQNGKLCNYGSLKIKTKRNYISQIVYTAIFAFTLPELSALFFYR